VDCCLEVSHFRQDLARAAWLIIPTAFLYSDLLFAAFVALFRAVLDSLKAWLF
jgi:hypothetical protein